MRKDSRKWVLEDHLCKECGGRILRCVAGGGPTGGGNPIFKCSCCGVTTSSMGPDSLCWCGFGHRLNHELSPYMCLPFSVLADVPGMLKHFYACGCDPKRGEVGIVLQRDWAAERDKRIVNGPEETK